MIETIHKRTIRSFVKREGRLTRGQERALNEHDGQLVTLGSILQPDALFEQPGPVVLEIGFGMGEALLAMAKQQPEVNFIGVEVHRPGVGALVLNCQKQGIDNIKVLNDDVTQVLTALVAHSLDRIQIFFPDPWHKKRHHKRRLIQPGFLTALARVLKLHGVLHIATDWAPYAEMIASLLSEHPDFSACDEAQRQHHLAARPATKYEARGLRHGHCIEEFVYQSVASV